MDSFLFVAATNAARDVEQRYEVRTAVIAAVRLQHG